MATSGSVDYSVNALTVLTDAYENIGVKSVDRALSANEITTGLRKLNLLSKQWMGSNDYAPGLKMWTRKRGYIFLQKGQGSYSLGPSGDNATSSYVTTTLSAAEALGQTALSITSETGITAADIIGIELDSGSIQWTTVVSTGTGSVTVTDALTGAAASGNRVFAYTTKIRRPLEILTAVLRDTDGNDVPVRPMDVYKYESIPLKGADGDPVQFYYETQRTNGVIYFDSEPDDVTKVVRIVFLSPIEDIDAVTDDIDMPQVWYRPLCAQLSINLCVPFNRPVTPALQQERDESLAIAQNADPDTTTIFFQPNAE